MICQIIHRQYSNLKLFAYYAELYKKISNNNDCIHLRSDLDALNDWTYDWLLKFNPSKCSVLKINSKISKTYLMNGVPLTTTNRKILVY